VESVTDVPFGFALPGGVPDPNDPAQVRQFMAQLQMMFANQQSGPVNWDLARQVALSSLTGSVPLGFAVPGQEVARQDEESAPPGNPEPDRAEKAAVAEALHLADLWLEPVCALPSGMTAAVAWSRGDWVTHTLSVWRKLCDPVAERMVQAMTELIPDEMRGQLGPMQSVVTTLGGALFGGQLGQALGSLAAEVLSAGDIGLPLGPAGVAALVPANIAAYGEGLEIDAEEVRLFVALREAAHQRLFGHVPWLRAHVLNAVETYAAGIRVNREAVEEAMTRFDPANIESMQEISVEGIFAPDDTPAQRAALGRLETALALVEGWVCHVVDNAAAGRLPNVDRMSEAFRRRRAAGGPAEQTFGALVGLELRPRRLREAGALWSALTEHRGVAGRDAVWGHPDLLPDADAFGDPEGYAAGGPDLDGWDLADLDATPAVTEPTPGGTATPDASPDSTATPEAPADGPATPDAPDDGEPGRPDDGEPGRPDDGGPDGGGPRAG
jgi:putative hydrolase